MSTAVLYDKFPASQEIRDQIASLEDELKALRRLLRASVAAERAAEARARREEEVRHEG
jgi:hypothetical protein